MRREDEAMPNLSPKKHDPTLIALGQAIQQARKARGLTQEAFAEIAGIDRSHFGRIERGENEIAFLLLIKIAKGLGTSIEDLAKSAEL